MDIPQNQTKTTKKIILGTLGAFVFGALLGAGGLFAYTRLIGSSIYDVHIPFTQQDMQTLGYGSWNTQVAGADFFKESHDSLIAKKASFVEANLTEMTVRVYKDGEEALVVPIKSKGREGSWWETPSGLYRAEGKERNHFSSFGKVFMPWSIPFQGNFFIHGWPYHEDGTPVPEGYSGGCIRLEDQYAEQVFNLVEVGMPILVYEDRVQDSTFSYTPRSPLVGATQYLVADLDSNTVLLSLQANNERTTHALTNTLTALVSSEYQNIDKTVDVSASLTASSSRVAKGGSYSIYQLFFPLLMEQDTYPAYALAQYFGNGRFQGLLEKKAEAMGMRNTSFTSMSEADASAQTNAEDVFLFLQYLLYNRSFLLNMSAGTLKTSTYGEPVWSGIQPKDPLFGTTGFLGGMYGASENNTQKDAFSILEVPFGKNGTVRRVAFIVFGSEDPARDTLTLKAHVQSMYE